MSEINCFLSSADGKPSWALSVGADLLKTDKKQYDFSLGLVENISISFYDLLVKADINITNIAKFYFILGPGSFTSLRTSFSFLNGLVAPSNVPIIGLSSFLVYWLRFHYQEEEVTLLMNANREENFLANFKLESKQVLSADRPISLAKTEIYNQILIPENTEIEDLVSASVKLANLDVESKNNLCKVGHLYNGVGPCELLYIKGVSAKTLKERGLT